MTSESPTEPIAPEALPANWWAEEDSEFAALGLDTKDKHTPASQLASFVRTAALWTVVMVVYLLVQYMTA